MQSLLTIISADVGPILPAPLLFAAPTHRHVPARDTDIIPSTTLLLRFLWRGICCRMSFHNDRVGAFRLQILHVDIRKDLVEVARVVLAPVARSLAETRISAGPTCLLSR